MLPAKRFAGTREMWTTAQPHQRTPSTFIKAHVLPKTHQSTPRMGYPRNSAESSRISQSTPVSLPSAPETHRVPHRVPHRAHEYHKVAQGATGCPRVLQIFPRVLRSTTDYSIAPQSISECHRVPHKVPQSATEYSKVQQST